MNVTAMSAAVAPLLVLCAAPAAWAQADAGPPDGSAPQAESESDSQLTAAHRPRLALTLSPKEGLHTGDVLHVSLVADAQSGDHVTIADQSFAPFEIADKRARSEPGAAGRTRFIFELDFLALDPGDQALPPIELRVVTAAGVVGAVKTDARPVRVASVLGNEPNAEPKPPTQPVVVMQDDYTVLYILYAVLGALLVALVTFLVIRWWERRDKPLPPPPPPRPPWEIAVERLGELRRRKAQMVEQGKGVEFVDEVSDVVRAYLGGLFGFEGLETTTDEMLTLLRKKGAPLALMQEVGAYLRRCDLVKFAKVVPDADEVDLIFAKAQDIVQFTDPHAQEQSRGAVAQPQTERTP